MLVLEDSPAGVAAARAAGAFVVGVPHDHSPADGLAAAHRLASRLDDPWLLDLFGSSEGQGTCETTQGSS
jgi:beta-phosphoglucomutase-like phosphatase (HAD superfamily)